MWKEMVVAYFEALCGHVIEGTKPSIRIVYVPVEIVLSVPEYKPETLPPELTCSMTW
jgi:hypothetical protein